MFPFYSELSNDDVATIIDHLPQDAYIERSGNSEAPWSICGEWDGCDMVEVAQVTSEDAARLEAAGLELIDAEPGAPWANRAA